MAKIMAPAHSRNEIAELAYTIRKSCGLENKLHFPVMHFLETVLPSIDDNFGYEIVEDRSLPGTYAEYDPVENCIRIRQSVYDQACKGNPHHRFTIAHEIGHYFLHGRAVAFARCSDSTYIPAYKDPEWQANSFAAALLMPTYLIENMSAEQVAAACGTSLQSATITIANNKKRSNIC